MLTHSHTDQLKSTLHVKYVLNVKCWHTNLNDLSAAQMFQHASQPLHILHGPVRFQLLTALLTKNGKLPHFCAGCYTHTHTSTCSVNVNAR